MNALALAEAFRAVLAADADFQRVAVHCEQSGATVSRPGVVLEVTARPLSGSGRAHTFTLQAWCESAAERREPSDPDPAATHAALVALVRGKLLGAGRVAVLAALNAAGPFDVRGWSAAESDPALDGNHFRTPVALTGTVLV